jgi:aminoglycoside phosphotransferase (APT) family kinase protein
MAIKKRERIPLSLEGVDASWLTSMLQTRYPDVVVETMDHVELIPGHTTKLRVHLGLNDAGVEAGIPANLCLKANWSGSPLSSPVCVNEARFYNALASQMPVPSPACYLADWDEDSDGAQGLVVLEDLIPQGGEFGYSHQPVSVDVMARALEGLAKMHGASWGHPALDKQDWLQTAMAPETVSDDYWMMMPDYFERHNRIPERVAIFPQWMAEDPNRLYSAFKQLCLHEMETAQSRCLVHGDAHLGNTFTRSNGDMVWIDWQIVRKGLPWRDLTYFLVGSLDIEDRQSSAQALAKHYLAHFIANGGPKFSFDHVWDEMARWVVWGLVAWQSNINPQQDTMSALRRFCAAADAFETHRFYRF